MEQPSHPPHVLIFPLPFISHINPMLNLAELLSLAGGFKITFLNTEYNHNRFILHSDICSRYMNLSGFQFKTITDGLPVDHPRTADKRMELQDSVKSVVPSLLKEMLIDIKPAVNCIIADGLMSIVVEVARELEIRVMLFRIAGAGPYWVAHSLREIIDAGELPIKDMDRLVKSVPGMENFLRCRDLPSFCRANDTSDKNIQFFMNEIRSSVRADAMIINTFEDLEGPILSQIRIIPHYPKLYTLGPINALFEAIRASKNILTSSSSSQSPNSLWEVDRGCLAWLDNQPPGSVIYVSFGSLAVLSRDQVLEFWHGFVNSKKRFLWVIRPDLISKEGRGEGDESNNLKELMEATSKKEGLIYLASWVPQVEVLAHKAIGGFLTHCGWNSILESIMAGLPMICWPLRGDQMVNSRFVGEVWKLGIDMKDMCDRKVVEKMVNDLMVERRDEFVISANRMAALAKTSVNEGGSSYDNLDRLINDIKMM